MILKNEIDFSVIQYIRMQIYKIGATKTAIDALSDKLISALRLGPTLWFVSGGTNIPLSVSAMRQIDAELTPNLTIALADERFVSYDDPSSNLKQLKDAGFDSKKGKIIEVLKEQPKSLENTLEDYQRVIETIMRDSKNIIGQFGMGIDGHIAGILPYSLAANTTDDLFTAYVSNPYTRITITFNGIKRINTVFLIALGKNKFTSLENLINHDLSLNEQPAQIIKQISEAYVYNDQMEDN